MKPKTQPCVSCVGGVMTYESRPDVEYQGHERTIETLAWWCGEGGKCGEGIFTGQPLSDHEKAFLALKAEVDGQRLDPARIGSTLDSFLKERGLMEEVDRLAREKLLSRKCPE